MKIRYERNKGRLCINCGSAPAYSKGRCEPCYRWWKRWGEDRPIEAVIAYGRRLLG